MSWICPHCGNPIAYEDYEKALRGARHAYFCRHCQTQLVPSPSRDELIRYVPRPKKKPVQK